MRPGNMAPWAGFPEFQRAWEAIVPYTLLTIDRCWTLWQLAKMARGLPGECWECGTYRGGTAMLLGMALAGSGKRIRVFDTFAGIPDDRPEVDGKLKGSFRDVSLVDVKKRLGAYDVDINVGVVPGTFAGKEDAKLAYCYADMDVHDATVACCEFVWPRLVPGGVMAFDDYGFCACPGIKPAVDGFFVRNGVVPFVLDNGFAVAFKGCGV